jgi:hypothetical protein
MQSDGQGRFVSSRLDKRTALGDLLTRHMAEATPLKKSAETDLIKLAALTRNFLCKLSLVALTTGWDAINQHFPLKPR